MPAWLVYSAYAVGTIGMVAVRAPHIKRSTGIAIISSRGGRLDKVFIALVSVGLLAPIVWIITDALGFADYPLRLWCYGPGVVCLLFGLWVTHRSHMDLGTNWSNTVELRQDHQLVSKGIYQRLRHPMYSGLLLYTLGQALVVPNWVAGPLSLFAFGLLVALRLRPEEQMMSEEFGEAYRSYMLRTKRLVPGLW